MQRELNKILPKVTQLLEQGSLDLSIFMRQFSFLASIESLEERQFVEKSIIELIILLITDEKLVAPSSHKSNKIYRSSSLKAFDKGNGYFPLSKTLATNCPGAPDDRNECVWFSDNDGNNEDEIQYYLGLTSENPLGLRSCRGIRDFDHEHNKYIAVIKLHDDFPKPPAFCAPNSFLLSRSLQVAINKCILIPIFRFFTEHTYEHTTRVLTFDFMISKSGRETRITKTIPGFECDDRYNTFSKLVTIKEVIEAWDMETGYRTSVYLPDRVNYFIFFKVIEIIESIINIFLLHGGIHLLGTVCENIPMTGTNCKEVSFASEWAIAVKWFTKPIRYNIFLPRKGSTDCQHKFYKYNASIKFATEIKQSTSTSASDKKQIVEAKSFAARKEAPVNINVDVGATKQDADLPLGAAAKPRTLEELPPPHLPSGTAATSKGGRKPTEQTLISSIPSSTLSELPTKNIVETDTFKDHFSEDIPGANKYNDAIFNLFEAFDDKEETKYVHHFAGGHLKKTRRQTCQTKAKNKKKSKRRQVSKRKRRLRKH